MKRRSKLLILVAVVAALCCLFVMVTSGADASGTWGADGDNLTWSFDSTTGKLTISGTGAMGEYAYSTMIPWLSYSDLIKTVEIAEGVTSIGRHALFNCNNLTTIIRPEGVTSIGMRAVLGVRSCTSPEIPSSVKLLEI